MFDIWKWFINNIIIKAYTDYKTYNLIEMRKSAYVIQFATFFIVFSCCSIIVFYSTRKKAIFMAVGSKLLFLYVLEREICISNAFFNNSYIFKRHNT